MVLLSAQLEHSACITYVLNVLSIVATSLCP